MRGRASLFNQSGGEYAMHDIITPHTRRVVAHLLEG
jgi:hypothetical protein